MDTSFHPPLTRRFTHRTPAQCVDAQREKSGFSARNARAVFNNINSLTFHTPPHLWITIPWRQPAAKAA
jgi:hypothetical protein